MSKRKTIEIEVLKKEVNTILRTMDDSTESHRRYRSGLMSLLEFALHECESYKGFRYLGIHEVPAGDKPGINQVQMVMFLMTMAFALLILMTPVWSTSDEILDR